MLLCSLDPVYMNLSQGSSPREGEQAAEVDTRKLRELATGAGMGLDTWGAGAGLGVFIITWKRNGFQYFYNTKKILINSVENVKRMILTMRGRGVIDRTEETWNIITACSEISHSNDVSLFQGSLTTDNLNRWRGSSADCQMRPSLATDRMWPHVSPDWPEKGGHWALDTGHNRLEIIVKICDTVTLSIISLTW